MHTIAAISPTEFGARTFHTAVFAGGGNRCWWQAGAVERLCEQANWQVQRVIGVSAGAGIATAFATGRLQDSLRAAVERFNKTPKNIVWADLLKGKRPFVLPRIYPDWIESFLQVPDLQRLQQGVLKVDVAITRPIPFLPVTLSTALALALYSTEKFWLKTFHGRVPHWVGLRPEYHRVSTCAHLDEARSLLLASAAAVPITPTHKVNGRAALDGGFYDNVPLPQDPADHAGTLVLLTRHRADLLPAFDLGGRTYVQPSRPVAATNMDCTSGPNVQSTYAQGREDMGAWLRGV
ncbi:MAG: patatin-like phospholipase family protein [Rhodoferax sp.]|nr:patatin-like phospholipase family protein [Rhodoferax sp.]